MCRGAVVVSVKQHTAPSVRPSVCLSHISTDDRCYVQTLRRILRLPTIHLYFALFFAGDLRALTGPRSSETRPTENRLRCAANCQQVRALVTELCPRNRITLSVAFFLGGHSAMPLPPLASHTLLFYEKSTGTVYERPVRGHLLQAHFIYFKTVFHSAPEHAVFIQKIGKFSWEWSAPTRFSAYGASTLAPLVLNRWHPTKILNTPLNTVVHSQPLDIWQFLPSEVRPWPRPCDPSLRPWPSGGPWCWVDSQHGHYISMLIYFFVKSTIDILEYLQHINARGFQPGCYDSRERLSHATIHSSTTIVRARILYANHVSYSWASFSQSSLLMRPHRTRVTDTLVETLVYLMCNVFEGLA